MQFGRKQVSAEFGPALKVLWSLRWKMWVINMAPETRRRMRYPLSARKMSFNSSLINTKKIGIKAKPRRRNQSVRCYMTGALKNSNSKDTKKYNLNLYISMGILSRLCLPFYIHYSNAQRTETLITVACWRLASNYISLSSLDKMSVSKAWSETEQVNWKLRDTFSIKSSL